MKTAHTDATASTPTGHEPALEARGMSKSFGGLVAVDDVSITAGRGRITALIGPNGAGKTTLFNMLTRFETADSGSISLFGDRVEALAPAHLARRGLVRSFQTPVGFPKLSTWENLMVGGIDRRAESLRSALIGRRAWGASARAAHDRAKEMLERFDLWEHRDTLLEDLPGGDVKLVDFARQLMLNPRILLLDEPAAGVDPSSINRLSDHIRELRDEGITILIIDHNISFVFGIADHVYVLDEGKVIAEGPPSRIAEDPRVIDIYLGGAK